MNWDYIAGFFDGEGYVFFGKTKSRKEKSRLTLTQTDKRVLEKIQSFIGYGIIEECNQEGNKRWTENWKISYNLSINKRNDVLAFLYAIKDKIIVKKEKVDNIIPRLEESIRKSQKVSYQKNVIFQNTTEMREKGMSWKEIGEVLGKNATSARKAYEWAKKKSHYVHLTD